MACFAMRLRAISLFWGSASSTEYTKILVSKKTEATSLTFAQRFPINLHSAGMTLCISKSINHLLDLCSSFIRQICEHFAKKSFQTRSPLGRILTAFFEQFVFDCQCNIRHAHRIFAHNLRVNRSFKPKLGQAGRCYRRSGRASGQALGLGPARDSPMACRWAH